MDHVTEQHRTIWVQQVKTFALRSANAWRPGEQIRYGESDEEVDETSLLPLS